MNWNATAHRPSEESYRPAFHVQLQLKTTTTAVQASDRYAHSIWLWSGTLRSIILKCSNSISVAYDLQPLFSQAWHPDAISQLGERLVVRLELRVVQPSPTRASRDPFRLSRR